jgi:GT2 family glycosyltransferase
MSQRFLAPEWHGEPRSTPPTFSVLIAAYQAADTIGDAVMSALEQTTPPLEIIVCDDGSTDDLEDALSPYLPHIQLIRQSNRGEAAAKNAAARRARGEFVVILDADDVFLPRRLEALGELATNRPDLDLLTTDAILEVDGVPVRRCYDSTFTFDVADQRRAILERNFIFGLAAVRREALFAVDGFDEALRYAMDWDCWLRLLARGARAGLVDAPLARYRLRATGLSAQRGRLLHGRVAVLERAVSNPDLTPAEHDLARREARRQLALASVVEASESLRAAGPDRRRLALRAALTPAVPAATRLRALAAAAAPHLAGSMLSRRAGPTGPAGLVLDPERRAIAPTPRGEVDR